MFETLTACQYYYKRVHQSAASSQCKLYCRPVAVLFRVFDRSVEPSHQQHEVRVFPQSNQPSSTKLVLMLWDNNIQREPINRCLICSVLKCINYEVMCSITNRVVLVLLPNWEIDVPHKVTFSKYQRSRPSCVVDGETFPIEDFRNFNTLN